MADKPVFWLDNDFLIKTFGGSYGDMDRFYSIMDGYAQHYEVRITDVFYQRVY